MAKSDSDKLREKGWKMLDNGYVQFWNFINSAVTPTEHHAVLAIRYVTNQKQLDAVLAKKDQPEQIQIGLNSQQCRYMADQLLAIADHMEKQAPPVAERH